MKYEIIKENKKPVAVKFIEENNEHIFGDGIRMIKTDKDGHEYVNVPNPNKDSKLNLFNNRIADAIDQIYNGIGDVLSCIRNGNFLDGDSVVLFIDRNYGNLVKMKSRLGWKGTKFCYCIKGGYQYSFNPAREILKNGELLSIFYPEERDQILTFRSKEEAENKIKELEEKAKCTFKKYDSFPDEKSEERYEYFKSVPFVVQCLWNNLYDHSKDWDYAGEFNLEVCQMIDQK